MASESVRNVNSGSSEFVDHGGSEDHDPIEETLELLGDPDAIRELVDAQAAATAGDVIRGVAAVRALRPPRLT